MKVKVLKIRVSDQFQNMDEAILNDYLERFDIIDLHTQMVLGDINYWSVLINYEEKQLKPNSNKNNSTPQEALSEEELIIYNKLKEWRTEKARDSQLPPYVIFHNAHLVSIAKHKPNTFEDFDNIEGLGKAKVEKYGNEVLAVLENA